MKMLLLTLVAAVFAFSGCGAYTAQQTPLGEPKDMSYCNNGEGGVSVGIEPYMMKDKTALVFDNDLRKEEILALDVSMQAEGDAKYKVRKSDITAVDEFGNKYEPVGSALVASRIDKAFRSDDPMLADDLTKREMPEEVTVSGEPAQHFLYFDMEQSRAEARKFTVNIPVEPVGGGEKKVVMVTVDPMRGHKNPMERWDSYDGRGISCWGKPAPVTTAAAAPAMDEDAAKRAEDAAKRAEDAAKRAEDAASKGEQAFEKSLVK